MAKNLSKKLFCIRHGEGWHNVNARIIGSNAYYDKDKQDPSLTELGINQAKELGKTWDEKKNIELIITSPLTRCIQTMNNIFENTNIPIVSVDYLREYPASLQYSNRRKNESVLKEKYKNIFFSLVSEEDDMWNNNKKYETNDQLQYRTEMFENFIKSRPEKNIAVVSHSTFLMNFLFNTIDEDESNELKHCYVYNKEFKSMN
jgi:broad specificity phosphatase PhoE